MAGLGLTEVHSSFIQLLSVLTTHLKCSQGLRKALIDGDHLHFLSAKVKLTSSDETIVADFLTEVEAAVEVISLDDDEPQES